MAVNDRQEGGAHYRAEYQHWDFVENNGLGYLEGVATKYVTRWNKKGTPVLDLEKARHYTEKLLELHEHGLKNGELRNPRGQAPLEDVQRFSEANELGTTEDFVVVCLSRWENSSHLQDALQSVVRLLASVRTEVTGGPE